MYTSKKCVLTIHIGRSKNWIFCVKKLLHLRLASRRDLPDSSSTTLRKNIAGSFNLNNTIGIFMPQGTIRS